MKYRISFSLSVAVAICAICNGAPCMAQDTIKTMYWDLSGRTTSPERTRALSAIVEEIKPDILATQFSTYSMDTATLANAFRSVNEMDSGLYFFAAQNNTMIFFNHKKFNGVSALIAQSQYGDQHGLVLESKSSGRRYCIMVANWPRLVGDNEAASHYRNALNILFMGLSAEQSDSSYGNIVVLGTFNARGSSDTGLALFSRIGDLRSPLVDVAGITGHWDSLDSYASTHTTSTSSGLLIRSSMALVSKSLLSSLLDWSVFGNDGKHYGIAVSSGGNDSVTMDVARNLEIASDNLPIVVAIEDSRVTSVEYSPLIEGIKEANLE